jgi:hypothetical protein
MSTPNGGLPQLYAILEDFGTWSLVVLYVTYRVVGTFSLFIISIAPCKKPLCSIASILGAYGISFRILTSD